MIKKCFAHECESAFQDKKYGVKKRVHNETVDNKLRCTVCGNTTEGSGRNKTYSNK